MEGNNAIAFYSIDLPDGIGKDCSPRHGKARTHLSEFLGWARLGGAAELARLLYFPFGIPDNHMHCAPFTVRGANSSNLNAE